MKPLVHQFPMRGGAYLGQVVAPSDMTRDEANRLCEFVRSLVVPGKPAATTRTRFEGRVIALTGQELVLKMWRVTFEMVTLARGQRAPRTHKRIFLVTAPDEYVAAADVATIVAGDKRFGRVISVRWVKTEAARLPLDISEIETAHTLRAAGRGYQAGMAAAHKAKPAPLAPDYYIGGL